MRAADAGEEDPFDGFDNEQLQGLFETYHTVAESVLRRWPLYPVIADDTLETLRQLPGYKEFNQLRPGTRFYLFICAMATSARARNEEAEFRKIEKTARAVAYGEQKP